MISHNDMMNIILTESLEQPSELLPVPNKTVSNTEPSCAYDLKLVKNDDGTLAWED